MTTRPENLTAVPEGGLDTNKTIDMSIQVNGTTHKEKERPKKRPSSLNPKISTTNTMGDGDSSYGITPLLRVSGLLLLPVLLRVPGTLPLIRMVLLRAVPVKPMQKPRFPRILPPSLGHSCFGTRRRCHVPLWVGVVANQDC
jgi:hypothetical protein